MEELKKAVALKYEREKDNAPKVVAKGKGVIAEKIIQTAKENGVYIKEDKYLVEMLSNLELYEEIPEELYKVVAKIFIFLYTQVRRE
ncbi:EscU/YscU/HrcU family type III secretion system export apparatus switch protein [Venenivibrio stagnispumantis]|uniref:Flagellar biosynthesis protein n=1 Tax=Venenivibrio stagnispumantis TaxID=407998 RepID=A0AA45WL74_9AQUI|nr:EscU/YscU/HrcU family type III secretion system export apparatus switch protein [Venenivibrio stagnispumantis]MCW4573685.1 EscU/YscU/HrcU family type III secretion system export apparatus switch protein [Venenivibrio stagnispumantis]SMP09935.1 flagellar biosynthesis protein [Venenivibrio stagnispumantis]